MNDEEWSIIEPILLENLPKKKQTCPLKWSYRQILDAVLYQRKNGCNWRDLPKDFPPYSTVYWHYKQWRDIGLIDKLLSSLHEESHQQSKKFLTA
jgi:transposase